MSQREHFSGLNAIVVCIKLPVRYCKYFNTVQNEALLVCSSAKY